MKSNENNDGSIVSREPAKNKLYVSRFGSFILKMESKTKDYKNLYSSIISALENDSRVSYINSDNPSHEWSHGGKFYSYVEPENKEDLLTGQSYFYSVCFKKAVEFTINVPVKNQPRIHGQEPQSSTYYVSWDGCTALVMWEPELDSRPHRAGGQVIEDVLRKACEYIGHELYVQACSKGCKHLFTHRDLTIISMESQEHKARFLSSDIHGTSLVVEGCYSPQTISLIAFDKVKRSAEKFAEIKNISRRMLGIDSYARYMEFELIAYDYDSIARSKKKITERFVNFFSDLKLVLSGDSRRRRANILIASLWLSMSNLETLQRIYKDTERMFKDSASDPLIIELFSKDLKSEEVAIASVDPHFARAAIAHKTQRMDNRVIVWATLGGAGMGAIITAVVTGITALP